MPIKGNRELVCRSCGEEFIVKCNDAITVEELRKLSNRLCLKCRIIRALRLIL